MIRSPLLPQPTKSEPLPHYSLFSSSPYASTASLFGNSCWRVAGTRGFEAESNASSSSALFSASSPFAPRARSFFIEEPKQDDGWHEASSTFFSTQSERLLHLKQASKPEKPSANGTALSITSPSPDSGSNWNETHSIPHEPRFEFIVAKGNSSSSTQSMSSASLSSLSSQGSSSPLPPSPPLPVEAPSSGTQEKKTQKNRGGAKNSSAASSKVSAKSPLPSKSNGSKALSSSNRSSPTSSSSSGGGNFSIKQDLFKTELCRNFKLQGVCQYGDKCKYAHGKRELRQKGHTINYHSRPCADTVRGSVLGCAFASRCNFLHPGDAVRHAVTASEGVGKSGNKAIPVTLCASPNGESDGVYNDLEYFENLRIRYAQLYPFGMFV